MTTYQVQTRWVGQPNWHNFGEPWNKKANAEEFAQTLKSTWKESRIIEINKDEIIYQLE